MMSRKTFVALLLASCVFGAGNALADDDWPQWGCDAQRSFVSPSEMPAGLKLQWVRHLPKPEKAWPDPQYMIHFDKSYEPIVKGKTLFVGSMVRDRVTAYDTETGEEKWRFYTEGPVRFAPVAFEDKLFFVSDDGFFYCLNAKTGKPIRKFRGGTDGRRGLGNGRLCSLWPARGGPVLYDGVIYFGASIWPFMGTFLYAVDPATGKVIWRNTGHGSRWTDQPHGGAAAFSGVAPQGYLAATNEFLVVANGRSMPGVFGRKTGQFRYVHMGSKWGGSDVRIAWGGMYVRGRRYNLATGRGSRGAPGFLARNNRLFRLDRKRSLVTGLEHSFVKNPAGKTVDNWKTIWSGKISPMLAAIHVKAGDHLYGPGVDGAVLGVALLPDGKAKLDFRAEIEGKLWRLIAGDKKLFAVTEEGRIYAFGTKGGAPRKHAPAPKPLPAAPADQWTGRAKTLLKGSDPTGGWAVSLGIGTGRLIDEILRQSKLHVIAVDRDADKVDALRRRMDDADLYGSRVTALVGDPFDTGLPPYVANLIFSEGAKATGLDVRNHKAGRIVRPIRPYNGRAVLPAGEDAAAVLAWAKKAKLDGATVRRAGADVVVERTGPLPGAGSWSHQYGDAANSVVSEDDRVRLPLGLLWFGGNTHLDVLPRHGHGPTPQVAAGRLVIEGINMLSARDVYTGRVIWKRKFQGFSNFNMYWNRSFRPNIYDRSYNQGHIAGANIWGANYVTAADAVYLINGPGLLVLDAATGETKKTFRLPERNGARPNWGVVLMAGDMLIAGAEPIGVGGRLRKGQKRKPLAPKFILEGTPGVRFNLPFGSGSRNLVAVGRHTGKVRWSRPAVMSYRHNAIIASNDKVFVIDGFSGHQRNWLRTMGQPVPGGTLHAIELETGKELWSARRNVTGTWLGYSKEHDILLQGGSSSRDRSGDETRRGLIAYRGRDGKLLWQDLNRNHAGPMILHGDTFITNAAWGGGMFDLKTGDPKQVVHPLTRKPVPQRWGRLYGCNTAIAGKHLMTFRSGAAGYFLLDARFGTGNFGGFKSGCTSSLIPADGVLNAPDYTRTCICAYQNQTSLAMIHMPDAEFWTYTDLPAPGKHPIRRVGINLGAPGDRLDGKTLWLDVPSVGARSPNVVCAFAPVRAEKYRGRGGKEKERLVYAGSFFRSHATTIAAGPLPWVAASGAENITVLTVQLIPGGAEPKTYTVRLVFAEKNRDSKAGDRVFDVLIQDKIVEKTFDIVKAAGGTMRSVVREYKAIAVKDGLTVGLKSVKGDPILCGVEAVAE